MLFAEFLEFICHKLYLGSDDDLNGSLARTHHASHTSGLDDFFIDLGVIFYLKAKSGNAVIDGSHILRTANTFQNNLRYFGEVVVGQGYLSLVCIVILTSRSLQIKLSDNNAEYNILQTADCQANRNQQPWILCQRSEGAEYHINCTAGEGEACADRKRNGNACGNTC